MIRIIAVAALLVSLAACNTVQGVGRDLSASGAVISGVADQARPVRRAPATVHQQPQPYYY